VSSGVSCSLCKFVLFCCCYCFGSYKSPLPLDLGNSIDRTLNFEPIGTVVSVTIDRLLAAKLQAVRQKGLIQMTYKSLS